MQEVHCSFYKKINELDDGTYSIARYHAISEVPKIGTLETGYIHGFRKRSSKTKEPRDYFLWRMERKYL